MFSSRIIKHSEMFSSIVVGILGFYYCSLETNASSLGRPRFYGPAVAQEKDIVEFGCMVSQYPPETILLQVFKQGDRSKVLAFYTSLHGNADNVSVVVNYATHDGYLECVASVQNNSQIRPTVSDPHHLKVVEPVDDASLTVLRGAAENFEGNELVLRCQVGTGSYVSYSWLLDDQPHFRYTHQELVINRTTPKDSGTYSCVATNQFNTNIYTVASPKVLITVKEFVSSPDISYTENNEDSQNYVAWVTCNSSKGTLPITFSLYDKATLVANGTTDERHATFPIPLKQGSLRCRAENGGQTAYSKWMDLQVVPVTGPVTMRYELDTGEDFSVTNVRFYCRAANGTHPRFRWFLNGTLLEPGRRLFHVVLHQPAVQSVLLLPVDKGSAREYRGRYHCEVSDLLHSTVVMQSEKIYIDHAALNRLSSVTVAVAFTCFGLLLTCVFTCCCVGVIFRRRWDGMESIQHIKIKSGVLSYEDDLDSEDYRENADDLTAAGRNDFDLGYKTNETQ